MERIKPEPAADERVMLEQYLDFQRATLLLKTAGLSAAQLATTVAPSSLTLAGLLKHAALNEHSWIWERFCGNPEDDYWAVVDWDADPDWEFRTATDDYPEVLRERYRAEIERGRAAIAGAAADDLSVGLNRKGNRMTLRWILLHMIEETSRHLGHADYLREAIDGQTGE